MIGVGALGPHLFEPVQPQCRFNFWFVRQSAGQRGHGGCHRSQVNCRPGLSRLIVQTSAEGLAPAPGRPRPVPSFGARPPVLLRCRCGPRVPLLLLLSFMCGVWVRRLGHTDQTANVTHAPLVEVLAQYAPIRPI